MNTRFFLAALAVVSALPAAAHKAHVHGAATLEVAIERSRLTLGLDVPLEDLVGFERAPKTDKERAAVEAAGVYFASGKAFAPNAEAGCRLLESKPEVSITKDHASMRVPVKYECAQAAELRAVTVNLFDAYPKVRRIDAQVAGARKQSKGRLTPQKRELPL